MAELLGLVCRRYFFSGRVQGVGFRAFCRESAVAAGLQGWVRNLADGRVEVLAQGSSAGIEAFERSLRSPFGWIQITTIEKTSETVKLLPPGFQIRG